LAANNKQYIDYCLIPHCLLINIQFLLQRSWMRVLLR